MEDEQKQTLLKKDFYENCPGCKVDQLKEMEQGLPIKKLFSIWIVVLCAGKAFEQLRLILKSPTLWPCLNDPVLLLHATVI